MFDSDIRIYGKHAKMLKKYSKSRNHDGQDQFLIKAFDGSECECVLFDTMMQTYLVSCALGIANNKQVKAETSGDDYATIFMDMVNKSRNSLIKLVQFMLLIENNNMSTEAKVKKAFSVQNSSNKDLEEKLKSYACGGLEILNSYFCECKTQEEVVNAIEDLNSDYSVTNLVEME
ncbi:hypothetical protein KSW27_11965 [Holdemanella biformis]|uniref:hypothetical protein n=1 Tax=Holdemanella biformis TaxID=1735 RepID=UPI001C27C726|nr:hypothetical protein [Holdemanella biformis]MBU9896903.1 hypothetical protein [Holdemanella biformis]MBV3417981.1 hypothetical protein [Holdemanella biformis]